MKSTSYQFIEGVLFRKNYDGFLLIFLEQKDTAKLVKELHDGPAGGHYSRDTTAHKTLRVGYYWPTLFKDTHAYVRKCDVFQ